MGWSFFTNGGERVESAVTLDGYTSDDFVMVAGDTMTGALILALASSGKNQLQITDTTIGAGLTIGADTNLYRSAANTLKTDDALVVTGALTGAASGATALQLTATDAGITFGGDVTFARSAALALDTNAKITTSKSFAAYAGSVSSPVQGTSLVTATTVSGTTLATGSISPTANRLLLAVVHNGRTAATPTVPTLSGNGLTWVQVATVTFNTIGTPRRRLTVFRAMGSAPTAGAVTASFGGTTQDAGIAIAVSQYINTDTSGTDGSGAVIQSNTNSIDAPTAARQMSVELANGVTSTQNGTVGFFAVTNSTSPSNITEFGTSLLSSLPTGSPPGAMTVIQSSNGYNRVEDILTVDNVSTASGAIIVEIKANGTPSDTAVSSRLIGDSSPRFQLAYDGSLQWSAGGFTLASVLHDVGRLSVYGDTHFHNKLVAREYGITIESGSVRLSLDDHFVGMRTNVLGGPAAVYLPHSRFASGKEFVVVDIGGQANVNNVYLMVQAGDFMNGVVGDGVNPDYTMNVPGETVRLINFGNGYGWFII